LVLKTFGNTQEKANITKVLAMNQGLYNGFLAAGLILGAAGTTTIIFFLSCVILAGLSVRRRQAARFYLFKRHLL